jgi:DUF1680 family protein
LPDAGLLDAHLLTGNANALTVLEKMAAYFLRRIDRVLEAEGEEHWQRVLEAEFGGMNDVLYRLFRKSGNPDHLRMARLFDKKVFFDPMAANRDVLGGHHANTHLAQVVGWSERAEATSDPEASEAVNNFFGMVTGPHAYATGGSSDKEFWFEPGVLGESIIKVRGSKAECGSPPSPRKAPFLCHALTDRCFASLPVQHHDAMETQETCTQYNILKIARSLFRSECDNTRGTGARLWHVLVPDLASSLLHPFLKQVDWRRGVR